MAAAGAAVTSEVSQAMFHPRARLCREIRKRPQFRAAGMTDRPAAVMDIRLSMKKNADRTIRQAMRPALLSVGLSLLGGCTTTPSDPSAQQPLYLAMSDEDVAIADAAVQDTLENVLSGATTVWQNASSGHSGAVTPKDTFKAKAGFFCRVYEETLSIGAKIESYTDTACRDTDGLWKPIE